MKTHIMNTKKITITDYKNYKAIYEVDADIVAVKGDLLVGTHSMSNVVMPISEWLEMELADYSVESHVHFTLSEVVYAKEGRTSEFDQHGRLKGSTSFATKLSLWHNDFPNGGRHIPTGFRGFSGFRCASLTIDGVSYNPTGYLADQFLVDGDWVTNFRRL